MAEGMENTHTQTLLRRYNLVEHWLIAQQVIYCQE